MPLTGFGDRLPVLVPGYRAWVGVVQLCPAVPIVACLIPA